MMNIKEHFELFSSKQTKTFCSFQIVSIWDWTNESDRPECALELKHEHSNQHHIQFNPRQSFQLVSNSTTQVLFYEWSHEIGLVCFDPELNEQV